MKFLSALCIFLSLSLGLAFAAEPPQATQKTAMETAIFAGGCFWCMQAAFEALPGVSKVTSGYTGGSVENPTYEQVSSGTTGHVEAVEVTYDPGKVKYSKVLEWFWDNVDPTDPDGQFCDKGSQYAAGIFYTTDAQKKAAEDELAAKEKKFGKKLTAFVREAKPFYPAEDYHQSYYKKNALHYKLYETACGRERTLKKIWNK